MSNSDVAPMTKAQAIELLGGTQYTAADRIGITQQAISAWPDVLSAKLRDRVQAVLWREHVETVARVMARSRRTEEPSTASA